MVIPWHSELLLVLYMAEPPKTKSGIRLPYYYLLYPDETILLLDILFDPILHRSSRRTPCGRTPLTESGLAAFPHPALCGTNRSHLSIIYTDIYSGSYQWIAVIYHIQKFYPVVAFLLTPPI